MVNKNNKLTRRAEYIAHHASLLACPICSSPLVVQDLKSLMCTNRHTFDIAKQGYLNLLNQNNKTNYDKKLFEARRSVIADSGFFDQFNVALTETINEQTASNVELAIVDMGSGEGSHLANISNRLQSHFNQSITGIGIDISKEGILEAARRYEESIWIVADLARTPLADEMCDVIINILSPSNYEEFKRVLKNDGVIIKVVPRESYLKELRHHFFKDSEKEAYSNMKVVDHFKEHFNVIKQESVHYTTTLDQSALTALVKMTPLTWNIADNEINDFLESGISEITVDLELLIGKKL